MKSEREEWAGPVARGDYLTAKEVAVILHSDAKTVRKWILRFHLGRRQGVFKLPGRYLFYWPTFEREFVQQQGDEGDTP